MICGEAYCNNCGDCICCFGDDPCYNSSIGEHYWDVPEGEKMKKKVFCIGGPRNFIFIDDNGPTANVAYGTTTVTYDSAVVLAPIDTKQRYKVGMYSKKLFANQDTGKTWIYIWEDLTVPQAVDKLKDYLFDNFMGELSE